jgi:fatty-acid peroxygenase
MGGEMKALRDRTIALVRHGYLFSDWLDKDTPRRGPAQPTRLLGRRSLVLRGPEGVQLFYDQERVVRRRGLPAVLAHSLFGKGAVYGLDGAEHRHRKQLFLDVTSPDLVADLAERVGEKWQAELDRWIRSGRGNVFPSAARAIGEAAQEWAGVPEAAVVMQRRARDLVQTVDELGTLGLPHVRARLARRRADAWAASLIQQVRSGRRSPPTGSVADVMSSARDPAGHLLPLRTAAVELLNVLRPSVAVSYFMVFAARQLDANPDLNDACATGNPDMVRMFSEEVRRLSPVVPVIAARSRCPFAWNGHRVRTGDRLLLDVYGTNHDPANWADADTFDPSRFRRDDQRRRTDFIPQGGGPVDTGHRCPGEGITISVLGQMIPPLARLDWRIHPDDQEVSLTRIPARPDGGLRLHDVRRTFQPDLF